MSIYNRGQAMMTTTTKSCDILFGICATISIDRRVHDSVSVQLSVDFHAWSLWRRSANHYNDQATGKQHCLKLYPSHTRFTKRLK